MIKEVLVPGGGMSGGKSPQANGEDVHMKKGYLGPVAEGRREAKLC